MAPVDMIVPATQRHALTVARRLRSACAATMRSVLTDPRRSLSLTIRETAFPYAWVRDGRILAIAGVAGPLIGLEGIAWIALTDEAVAHPLAMARLLVPTLQAEKEQRCRLVTTVRDTDSIAIRFAEWCGFRAIGEHGPGFIRYAWERDDG